MASEEMGSDGSEGGEVPGDKTPRRVSKKQVRFLAIIAVVVVIIIVLVWNMVPERIYEVSNVTEEIDDLDGEYINVKGVVVSWESGQSNYTLADTNDANITIEAVHTGGFPEGFGLDATVVARGVVKKSGISIELDSDEIQIGCPSKY